MAQAFTPGLQRRRNYTIVKTRELSVPGKILVGPGDMVKAGDIVAKAELPGEMVILRVAEQIGIEPFEMMNGLKVKEGQEIKKGDLICEHAGLFGLLKSRFRSPYDGRAEFITAKTGHIGLRFPSVPLDLSAYISGEVQSVVDGKSVTIRTGGVYIQGIFGIGGEKLGKLARINVSADHEVTESDLPAEMNGCILFGGARADYGALKKASDSGAAGFITGSIDDQTLSRYLGYDLGLALTGNEDLTMSVIVTEGFGNIPMSAAVLDMLTEFDGHQASINGATQVRAGAIRPEIVVPGDMSSGAGEPESESEGLRVGARVRLIRVPYFGLRGTVTELPHEPQRIETGALTRVLKARLDDDRIVTVPRANVEL